MCRASPVNWVGKRESCALATQWDALLPNLVTGELRVRPLLKGEMLLWLLKVA